jgi:hypothetical protein
MTQQLPTANIRFILLHKQTQTEIIMPIITICDEYSGLLFQTSEKDYNGKYNAIGALPCYPKNDSITEYDLFIEINGTKHILNAITTQNFKEVPLQKIINT